jgi:hypothetical protein
VDAERSTVSQLSKMGLKRCFRPGSKKNFQKVGVVEEERDVVTKAVVPVRKAAKKPTLYVVFV